jgi:ABC-2 type transport system permease protein
VRPAFLLIRNHILGLRSAIRELKRQPKLKVVVIGGFSITWLCGLSWLFYSGFDFLYSLGGAAFFLVQRLFTLFFMGLGLMLMLSGAVTGYSNLLQSPELRRLITWPVPLRDLFYYSLVRTTLMSSWAFFFIIVPFIGAFGVYRGWHVGMILWSVAFSAPFVMLFSGLGVLMMLLIVRWIPRGRTLALLAVLLVTFGLWKARTHVELIRNNQQEDIMNLARFVPGLEFSSQPLLPNGWMARGILALAQQDWTRGLLYLTLLCSSVGVLFLLIARVGSWLYPSTLQRQNTSVGDWAQCDSRVSRFLHSLFPGTGPARAFGIKDALVFVRDPSQWSQFLIFFGLLSLYFLNLGSLGYDDLDKPWANLIAFLNMFSLSAVMSSLSSRFVFPQLSLESKTLWLVALAPVSLTRMMLIKFVLSSGALLLIGGTLTMLSNAMLDLPEFSLRLSTLLMPCVAFALAGMATGLGAIFMETEAKTPAQILSGYGGTLNLILTLLTVILLVLVPGIVSHLSTSDMMPAGIEAWLFPLTSLYIVLISLLAGALPLYLGHRSLSNRDF